MMYHKTWNPWIYENGSLRRTSETTFFRPLTYKKPIRIFVGTEADFFDPKVPHTWRRDAVEIMSKRTEITFLIPSVQPDLTCILPNTWIGLKITDDTNIIKLLKSIEHLPFVKRWALFDSLTKPIDVSPMFRCDSEVHGGEGCWHQAYPCDKCMGDGYLNKYMIEWAVVSGSKTKYMDVGIVRKIQHYADVLQIPFYYKQALIGGKLIREPYLDGNQYNNLPRSFI
jgi:protein gp37